MVRLIVRILLPSVANKDYMVRNSNYYFVVIYGREILKGCNIFATLALVLHNGIYTKHKFHSAGVDI